MPQEQTLDSSLALLRDPYRWIGRRADAHGRDAFGARILGERTVLMRGPDAAAAFYDARLVTRRGGEPHVVLGVLQGHGSVSVLDDEEHHRRKAMHLSLMTPERLQELVSISRTEWDRAIERWRAAPEPVSLDVEVREVLARTFCAWAGVPLSESSARTRSQDLAAMFEGAGAPARFPRALLGRLRCERWALALVAAVRAGRLETPPDRALAVIARYRDGNDELLPATVAVSELLNLLRPGVAVGRFITYAAAALQASPEHAQELRNAIERREIDPSFMGAEHLDGPHDALWRFVQEVRRTAPFFPAMFGRALHEFEIDGVPVHAGERVILDLYGTSRDPRSWSDPEAFRPERFAGWEGDPVAMVPQGGGDHAFGHRCAGEWATIALMRAGVGVLVTLPHELPAQDLGAPWSRIPTRPRSGYRMELAPR